MGWGPISGEYRMEKTTSRTQQGFRRGAGWRLGSTRLDLLLYQQCASSLRNKQMASILSPEVRALCEFASHQRDSDKLLALIQRISKLLEEEKNSTKKLAEVSAHPQN